MAFEYLKEYTTFNSVEEMDQHVEKHIQAHYYNLTKSERAIVFKIAAHALQHPGACHLKVQTIADSLEISERTVYRAIKKLEKLGIIRKENTIRSQNGGQGANIYVILPFELNVSPEMSVRENADKANDDNVSEQKSENQPLNSFNLLNNSKDTYAAQSLTDVDNLLTTKEQTPYQRLKQFVSYFVKDNKLASKCYGIFLAQTAKQINKPSIEIAIEALKYTFRAVKRKKVYSITGYFNNTLRNLLDKYYEDLASKYLGGEVEFVNGKNMRGPEWLYW
ncbi:helix-turn-helix domain-containing protein [Ureibacillus sp. FSL K6-0165]|uniref:helix-turn-helix domain-containing protein n=1 Tax=Ureibacillus sp. FSL K6-0165 TaxID=2954606 RepID=UPI0030F76786